MTQRYDVIIVGGGPAGGTAAFFLGQAGKRVLLLEKESLPRHKICGGAVSLRSLEQFPFSFEPVIQSRVHAISYTFKEKMVTIPPLPIYRRREPISTARTLLVGDAAGLVNPFTGEGIRFAIKSGRLAAEAILAAHPEEYAASVNQRIGRNHRLGTLLTDIFYSMPGLSFELSLRNPSVSELLARMIDDRIGYSQLIPGIIRSFPSFVLGKKIALDSIRPIERFPELR